MKARLIDVTLTTDQARYDSCPSIQANRHDPSLKGLPFTSIAGRRIKIYSIPVVHNPQQHGSAYLCELPHFTVWHGDAIEYGHATEAWVCAHMADIPD
jgi:hypothetical protein